MRTIADVPEGGSHVEDLYKYKVEDAPDAGAQLGEGVTREWVILYHDNQMSLLGTKDKHFIVHALTKEGAFDHFITLKPHAQVKAVRFYGHYW